MMRINNFVILFLFLFLFSCSSRYETAKSGRWDLRLDKEDGFVYKKNALQENADWYRTGWKSIRQAQYSLERIEREDIAERQQQDLQEKFDDIKQQQDDITEQQDDIKQQQDDIKEQQDDIKEQQIIDDMERH